MITGNTAVEEQERFSTKGYRARKTAISKAMKLALETYEAVEGRVHAVSTMSIMTISFSLNLHYP